MAEAEVKGYAIVDHSGYQFRVETGQELKVPYAAGEPGTNLLLDRVLLLHDGSVTHFGSPVVEGAVVDATILSHGRDPKVIVFKYRRRKGYRRKRGHRQQYSVLRINGIRFEKSRPAPKAEAKKEPATKVEAKAAPKKPVAAKAKTTAKKAAPTKAAEKKPAAAKKKEPATTPAKKTAAPKKAAPTKKATGAKKPAETGKPKAGKAAGTKKTGGSGTSSTVKSGEKKKSSD
jgi:large subunit ribosomal protein L21